MQLHDLYELGDEFERLVENNQIKKVFLLIRENPFIEGYQTFEDEFMFDAHNGTKSENFKERLLTFLHKNIHAEVGKAQATQERILNDKQTEIAQAEKKLNGLHQEINQAKAELNELHQQINQAKAELNELHQQISQAKNILPAPAANAIITEEERAAQEWFKKAQEFTNYEDSIRAYNKVIELKPEYAEAYFGRGLAKYRLKQYQKAVLDFTTTIDYNIHHIKAHHYRGRAQYRLEQCIKAIMSFDEAILLDPSNDYHYWWRAVCYSHLRDKDRALRDLQQAIQLKDSYKVKAKQDEDFIWLRRNADFKKLVE